MINTRKLILIAFTLSGMAALIYEIVWIRPIQFILGSTIYTISIVLGGFLMGLSIGSYITSRYFYKIKNPLSTYAIIEIAIGIYGILFISIINLLPDLYRMIFTFRQDFYIFTFLQFVLSFLLILIPTTLMGATYPLVSKYYTQNRIGKGIGEVYSANNMGAILGSMIAGFILLSFLGVRFSIIFAAVINLVVGFVMISVSNRALAKKLIPAAIAVFVVLSVFSDLSITNLYTSGFTRANIERSYLEGAKILYHGEGLEATVTVIEEPNGGIGFLVNGKGAGSNDITDIRTNSLLAYLPLLLHPNPEKSFVIGLGTGTTSGILSQHTETTTAEIESRVVEASDYFTFMNLEPLSNPNHKIIISDARNTLFISKEKFDIIVTNPVEPWQSFSSVIFSRDFLEIARTKLNDDGLFVQWVPIYTLDTENFKIFYKTFNSVFPYVMVFSNLREDENFPVKHAVSELIFIGSVKETSLDGLEEGFNSLPLLDKQFLTIAWLESADKIYSLYRFNQNDLAGYADASVFVTDDNPILEFSTPQIVMTRSSYEILPDIEKYISRGAPNG